MAKKKVAKKRGPKPETLKIEGDWKDAMKHALKRGKPQPRDSHMPDDVPLIHQVPDKPYHITKIPGTWEPHPDGRGGYRPTEEAARGAVNIPCPSCHKPLVRDGTTALVNTSTFGCPCGAKLLGDTLFLGAGEPEPPPKTKEPKDA